MRRFFRDNSLSIFFGILFLGALVGQAIAGHAAYNADQLAHGDAQISLGRYLTSSSFGRAVLENWQSEYLQFILFMIATVWLLQRGSPESKPLDKPGRESEGNRSSPATPTRRLRVGRGSAAFGPRSTPTLC